MSAKFSFTLRGEDRRRPLPSKLIIGQRETETLPHVMLKLLAYLLFFRERLQLEAAPDFDAIPFVPDLVQYDYELRPALWIECGECSVAKLDKLAVKAPEAEIWIVKRSPADAEHLLAAMAKAELRRGRYNVLAFDAEMFSELCSFASTRNEVTWFKGHIEPPLVQFEFNGLWFEGAFTVMRF